MFGNSIRDGTKIYKSMTKVPLDDVLENLHQLRIRESDQLKTVFVQHENSSEDIDEVEDNGEEKHRSETSIAKF